MSKFISACREYIDSVFVQPWTHATITLVNGDNIRITNSEVMMQVHELLSNIKRVSIIKYILHCTVKVTLRKVSFIKRC